MNLMYKNYAIKMQLSFYCATRLTVSFVKHDTVSAMRYDCLIV